MRLAYGLLLTFALFAGVPTIDGLLELETIGSVSVSPDGKLIAYSVSEADFEQNAFVSQIWLVDTTTGRNWQVTRGKKSSNGATWSPDGRWLAFTSDREGGKSQIFALPPDGGEAVQLTKSETGVNGFEWSRDGSMIAYTASEKRSEDRKKYLGEFEVVHHDYAFSHLFTFPVAEAWKAPVMGRQRTQGHDYSVGGFEWSPNGQRIAFTATRNPDLIEGGTAALYVLTLEGDGVRKLVESAGPHRGTHWSPDGRSIAFTTAMGNPKFFYKNMHLAVVSADGGTPRAIAAKFDEQPNLVEWKTDGLYFTGLQKTAVHLFRADPATGEFTRISKTPFNGSVSLTGDGKHAALLVAGATQLSEVCFTNLASWSPRRLTDRTAQVKDWTLGQSEVISWKSKDGAEIEGVLTRPKDWDASRKYPLLCVIHGGPTGIDVPQLVHPRYYPVDLWSARGALILRVNYRGSAGYGERFRELNVRNLGVGDAWDVESGVDSLIAKGWVDPRKVGVMGWSQGGYISAFLTTTSTKFAAISVGAGISNWATYYYNTDITPFTIQYLDADPATDPEIYRKTSPMTYIKQAKTPTLIQHGELDRRVPIPNAYELRQALEDRGVPVEMVVYKGFGHGITKPREMRAVMRHNLEWFNHYIFGDPMLDFAHPEVPKAPSHESLTSK